jgi:hypothetical protein
MKRILNLKGKAAVAILLLAFVGLFDACQKDDVKAVINPASGVSMTLTPSATTVVLDSTAAATTTAATLTWNAPNYGVQVSVTYTLQIDSMTGGFINPTIVNLGNVATQAYTKAALNLLALNYKLKPAVAGQIQFRVKADIGVGYQSIYSAAVPITITPYSLVIPPKFPVPDSLYIVGSATAGAWNNPVPTPSQKLTKIDYHTFGAVLQLTTGNAYDFLPVNGNWANKYNVSSSSANPLSDSFQPSQGPGSDIPAPAASGLYKIIVDFVTGKYTLTLLTTNPIPANLYIVGDATSGGSAHGWDNPVPVPAQQFKQVSNGEFIITIPLLATGSYLFLPLNGDWTHKYGGASATGGAVLADGNVPNSNTPGPGAAGNYVIDVNFFTNQYKVTKQ